MPAAWVALATARQTSNGSNPESDWDQGYGFQFWRCRHNAYRGDGAFGQYCLVMPEQDAVVAITSGVKDMQAVLNVVWDKLLPALQAQTLAPNPEAAKRTSGPSCASRRQPGARRGDFGASQEVSESQICVCRKRAESPKPHAAFDR